MKYTVNKFSDLSLNELYEILKLRSAVFVVEQNCAYQDVDGIDRESIHVCGYDDDGLAAYLRIFLNNDDDVQIGRVISVKRGTGAGRAILKKGIETASEYFGKRTIVLEAQVYAIGFYEKEGFRVISEPFDEDGIMHVRMERKF